MNYLCIQTEGIYQGYDHIRSKINLHWLIFCLNIVLHLKRGFLSNSFNNTFIY